MSDFTSIRDFVAKKPKEARALTKGWTELVKSHPEAASIKTEEEFRRWAKTKNINPDAWQGREINDLYPEEIKEQETELTDIEEKEEKKEETKRDEAHVKKEEKEEGVEEAKEEGQEEQGETDTDKGTSGRIEDKLLKEEKTISRAQGVEAVGGEAELLGETGIGLGEAGAGSELLGGVGAEFGGIGAGFGEASALGGAATGEAAGGAAAAAATGEAAAIGGIGAGFGEAAALGGTTAAASGTVATVGSAVVATEGTAAAAGGIAAGGWVPLAIGLAVAAFIALLILAFVFLMSIFSAGVGVFCTQEGLECTDVNGDVYTNACTGGAEYTTYACTLTDECEPNIVDCGTTAYCDDTGGEPVCIDYPPCSKVGAVCTDLYGTTYSDSCTDVSEYTAYSCSVSEECEPNIVDCGTTAYCDETSGIPICIDY